MKNVEYPIQPGEPTTVEMPEGTVVLAVQRRQTGLVLLCQDPEAEGAEMLRRTFRLMPHVEPITRTVIQVDGKPVKHDLFEDR